MKLTYEDNMLKLIPETRLEDQLLEEICTNCNKIHYTDDNDISKCYLGFEQKPEKRIKDRK